MAEFCLDCLNKICNANEPKRKFVMSKELYLCEECGEMKYVVICYRRNLLSSIFRRLAYWLKLFIDNLRRRTQHKKL